MAEDSTLTSPHVAPAVGRMEPIEIAVPKSKNTPFDGWSLRGGVAATIVGGRAVYVNESVDLRI